MINSPGVPMVAIRVFAAVGRHGNFTRAAAALGITQSAVSRHIASLEKQAARSLFERRGPNVSFTPAGSQFYEAVRDAVSTIEMATQQLLQRQQTHERMIIRTSMPSFAMAVLVPALGGFTETQPVKIDLVTSLSPPQPNEDFDVLVTRDLNLPGAESWELVQEELVCVGSRALVDAHRAQGPDRWPIIAARSRPDAVPVWALAKDISADDLHVGAVYDHLFLAVAAAIGGAGFLVAPLVIVQDQLKSGALAQMDDARVVSGAQYVAYVNEKSRHVEMARDFCRWLKRTMRERGR